MPTKIASGHSHTVRDTPAPPVLAFADEHRAADAMAAQRRAKCGNPPNRSRVSHQTVWCRAATSRGNLLRTVGRMKVPAPDALLRLPATRERDFVPQGTGEAMVMQAEDHLCGAGAVSESADGEPLSSWPGSRPGDHRSSRR